MSNILNVINPPEAKPQTGEGASSGQDKGSGKPEKQCTPCLLTSAAVMILGGSYMASGAVFSSSASNPLPKAATPAWRNTVRVGGVAVAFFGILRGMEAIKNDTESFN
ncbi:hypothetical protein TRVA0_012S00672 [Trichomonascus vanleenenianus]|uniref:Dmo2p n=1 Tax=Trichomonascus vanleenenianus TaxID=2268995 RepID=UPI003EC9E2C7